jgi:hypothetical protein
LTAANPPSALTELALGTRIEGTVLAPGGTGALQIATALGTLALEGRTRLPPEAKLVLELLSLSPRVTLIVASLNGRPFPASDRAGAPSAGAAATGQAAGAFATTDPARVAARLIGTTVNAVVLRPAPLATSGAIHALGASHARAPGGGGPGAVPGTPAATTNPSSFPSHPRAAGPQAAARGASGPTPPASPLAVPAPPAPGASRGVAPVASVRPDAPAHVQSSTVPQGTQIHVKIVNVRSPVAGAQPPQSPPPAATGASLAPGTTLTGVTTHATPAGHTVIRTELGTIALETRAPVPQGTTVQLVVTGGAVYPPAPSADAEGRLARSLALARDWPSLNAALAALEQDAPAVARTLVETVIPRADSQLAANILSFLAALRGGGLVNWLGEGPARTLQRLRPDVFNRLSDDFRSLARSADEPVAGNWRATVVPFHNGQDLRPITLYLRRDRDADGDDAEPGRDDTRFVVDVELSRLGRMQLDGFVRGGNKHFDLIVRTEKPLPSWMRDDIREIFADACALTGLKGGTSFHSGPAGFIDVAEFASSGPARDLFA